MRRSAAAALALLAAWMVATPAWASSPTSAVPFFLSSFEVVGATDSFGRTSLEWTTATTQSTSAHVNVCQGGAAAPDCSGFVHRETNGGDATSHWGLTAAVQAGAAGAYVTLPQALSQTTVTIGAAVHLDTTAPASARTILATVDSQGPLCSVAVNADRSLGLYSRGTLVATTPVALFAFACSQDPTRGCTADADCGSGNRCGLCTGGTPGTPCTNVTDSSGAYFAGLELTTQAAAPNLTCTLWVNGQRLATALTTPTTPPGAITQVQIGPQSVIAGGDTAALTIALDDVVLATTPRAGFGAVATLTPRQDASTNGTLNQWTQNLCSGSHFGCINDYGRSPYTDDGADLKTGQANKLEDYFCSTGTCAGLGPTPQVPAGGGVAAVEAVLTVTTATGNQTRDLRQDVGTCGTQGCVWATGSPFTLGASLPLQIGHRDLFVGNPVDGGGWEPQLPTLAYSFRAMSDNAALVHVEAAVVYVRLERTAPLPITLRDRNPAIPGDPAQDGKLVVACYGDSTTYGTAATVCQGGTNAGQPCSQGTYCSFSRTQDEPTGGCAAPASCTASNNTRCGAVADASCQTCTGRRPDFNSGAGYACGPNNGGATCDVGCTTPDSTGKCATDSCTGSTSGTPCAGLPQTCTGTCPGDPTVGCNVGSDCNLGLCDTCDTPKCAGGSQNTPGGFCVLSCPPSTTGRCPNQHESWCEALQTALGADVLLRCGLPGETGGGGINRILNEAQTGLDPYCATLVGTGLGCRCGVGGATTAAEINGQCGPGGTCSCQTPGCDGTCTAGPGATCHGGDCAYCTDNAACSSSPSTTDGVCTNGTCTTQRSGAQCRQYPADDYVQLEGTNDAFAPPFDPECRGWGSAQVTGSAPGDWCSGAVVRCTRDADCTGVDPASRCIGYGAGGTGSATTGCIEPVKSTFTYSLCTETSAPCRVDADCSAVGGTTTGRCVGGAAGTSYPTGFCACTQDSDCASGSSCVGYTTSPSECGTTATCVCRLNCTSDSDCGRVTGSCTCPPGQTCPTTHSAVCNGMCSLPSSSVACTSERDCARSQGPMFTGQPPHSWVGACVAGHCAHTGTPACPATCWRGFCLGTSTPCTTPADCAGVVPQSTAWALGVDTYALGPAAPGRSFATATASSPYGWLATVVAQVAALSTPPPLYWAVTIPRPQETLCHGGASLPWYFQRLRPALLDRYPRQAIDAAAATGPVPNPLTHTDIVHFSQLGAQLVGGAVATVLGSRNVCSTGTCLRPGQFVGAQACGTDADCTPPKRCNQAWAARPSRYCRGADGTWTQTSCSTDADCTSTQRCLPKPCVCACGNSADCVHWYGAGATCLAGRCQAAGGGDACALYGAFTCAADGICRDGTGADVCQSATVPDACNPE